MNRKTPSSRPSIRPTLLRRAGQVMLVGVALATISTWLGASATPVAVAPQQVMAIAGQKVFSVADVEWMDESRARRVPARLYWPASGRQRQVPLVVFSHGIGSSREGYAYLGRYWASHGIASLHLQHVGSDRSLWQGNVLSLVSRFQAAASEGEAISRVQDLSFALDRLLESGQGALVARDRIVAAGHSYGANTTMLVAGARIMRDGKLLQLRDPRIAAAIVLSAPPFYGELDVAPILAGIDIPTLHVTTADDVIRIPGFGSGLEDRISVFDATGGPFKALAVYKHGSHNVFTEQRYFDSVETATQIKTATEELSLAFLDQVFGKTGTLEAWENQHSGLMTLSVIER